MDTIDKNLYNLLRTKEIIAILDGDTKFGDYETANGKKIPISMPYLSGPDLCALSTKFGLPVTYSWGGTNLSRWVYLNDLLEHCIKFNKCSNLLKYMFSMEQFKNVLKGQTAEEIESAYEFIVREIIGKINGILYFGGHELVREGDKYSLRVKLKSTEEESEKKHQSNILDRIITLIEDGERLRINDSYTNELYKTYCESWMGEVNILNERH